MRIAILVAVLILATAASASAASSPPPQFPQTWHVVTFDRVSTHTAQVRACMASRREKIFRWFAPVACEQPPRSELVIPVLLGG